MAILKRLKGLDWLTLTAEIVLIFVGITLALWFDNRNESALEFERETRVLSELSSALAADARDLGGNLREDSLTLHSIETVLRHLEQRLPYSPDLDAHFAQSAGISIFLRNDGAYEHLKATGIDLIKTDTLRLAVVQYHEYITQSAQEWERSVVTSHWQQQLNPQLLLKFRYRQRKEPAAPLDYQALLDDVEYQNVLRHMSFALGFKAALYRRARDARSRRSTGTRRRR